MTVTASPRALARARRAAGTLALTGNSPFKQRNLMRARARAVSRIPAGLPPALKETKSDLEAGEPQPPPTEEGAPVHGRAALVAAAAAQRDILPINTTLKVYWNGSHAWFDTKVLGHRARLVSGTLHFKHLCEYEGGAVEHDLALIEHEILDLATTVQENALDWLEQAENDAMGEHSMSYTLNVPKVKVPTSMSGVENNGGNVRRSTAGAPMKTRGSMLAFGKNANGSTVISASDAALYI